MFEISLLYRVFCAPYSDGWLVCRCCEERHISSLLRHVSSGEGGKPDSIALCNRGNQAGSPFQLAFWSTTQGNWTDKGQLASSITLLLPSIADLRKLSPNEASIRFDKPFPLEPREQAKPEGPSDSKNTFNKTVKDLVLIAFLTQLSVCRDPQSPAVPFLSQRCSTKLVLLLKLSSMAST